MKKYTHPLTKELTPDNWKDKLNLNALSTDELTSIFGDLKAMEALAKKVGGYLKEVIKTKMPKGEDVFTGTNFAIERTFSYRAGGLDRDRCLEDMGEDWIEEHSKEGSDITTIRCKRIEPEED